MTPWEQGSRGESAVQSGNAQHHQPPAPTPSPPVLPLALDLAASFMLFALADPVGAVEEDQATSPELSSNLTGESGCVSFSSSHVGIVLACAQFSERYLVLIWSKHMHRH